MKSRVLNRLAAFALAAGSTAAIACADSSCYPGWTLFAGGTACESRAMLAPGNDTRTNLLFLLRDRGGAGSVGLSYPGQGDSNSGFGHVFLDPGMQANGFYPGREGEEISDGTRCTNFAAAGEALQAAMAASRGLPASEAAALLAARAGRGQCGSDAGQDWPAAASKPGREFLGYLQAAEAFYGDDWGTAQAGFAALGKAGDPWVRETAAYMQVRVAFAAAQAAAFGDYGNYLPDKVDQAEVARGQAALAAYLKTWPKGRYAGSAQGLVRRGLWLARDYAGLTREYERLLAAVDVNDPASADLVQEIDNKLLFNPDVGTLDPQGAMLLATLDLKRMRAEVDPSDGEVYEKPSLTGADLAGQAPLFAGQGALYGFLQANHAFYLGKDYARVLQLIPDDARQPAYSNLAFSRQVLRGMALGAKGDPNEAGFWRELLGGAKGLWQRSTAELGLAMNWERHGKLAAVFAKGSPIEETMIRRELLIHSAGAPVLRMAAADGARPQYERDLALFVLLYKDLSRGDYAGFLTDQARVRGDANTDGGLWRINDQETIPLGKFTKGRSADGYACPALAQTARALAANPRAVGPRLCLGDFWRINDFDGFTDPNTPNPREALGGSGDQFAGQRLARGEIYRSVIADRTATAPDKAYALYRAVMCYAPSGSNSCGDDEVPTAQRKAWYDQLKRDYPTSPWARKLRYFW